MTNDVHPETKLAHSHAHAPHPSVDHSHSLHVSQSQTSHIHANRKSEHPHPPHFADQHSQHRKSEHPHHSVSVHHAPSEHNPAHHHHDEEDDHHQHCCGLRGEAAHRKWVYKIAITDLVLSIIQMLHQLALFFVKIYLLRHVQRKAEDDQNHTPLPSATPPSREMEDQTSGYYALLLHGAAFIAYDVDIVIVLGLRAAAVRDTHPQDVLWRTATYFHWSLLLALLEVGWASVGWIIETLYHPTEYFSLMTCVFRIVAMGLVEVWRKEVHREAEKDALEPHLRPTHPLGEEGVHQQQHHHHGGVVEQSEEELWL